MIDFNSIKVISFDADDTLWQNENLFRRTEQNFCNLMRHYTDKEKALKILWEMEVKNIPLYGYGIKAFVLDMLEAGLKISKNKLTSKETKKIINLGTTLIKSPIVLFEGAENTLKKLSKKYKLIVTTKGDLLEQENKVYRSGLTKYLHHIEVMSEKDKKSYARLIKELNIKPEEFLMVGNSVKSDILPVLSLGAKAVFIPSKFTWFYEDGDASKIPSKNYLKLENISQLLKFLIK
ncbi:MAG: HAD family hydrolase [Elusimicrobiaceae bacterium]|nr:HAD family hydrolase [Elusimicrobiaceae bacterium]